jgi:nucleotide-binding universal stress UspA family protein
VTVGIRRANTMSAVVSPFHPSLDDASRRALRTEMGDLVISDFVPPEWAGKSADHSFGGQAHRLVLVAVNRRDLTDQLLAVAGRFAHTSGRIRVLHLRERTGSRIGPMWKESALEATAIAEQAVARLRRLGVKQVDGTVRAVDSHLVAKAIAREARSREAELVVVGSRSRRPLASFLFGGTSSAIVRLAPCPVVVVPPGQRQ